MAIAENLYTDAYIIDYKDGDVSLERISFTKLGSTDKVHTVKAGETLQSIAYRYYGNSGLWYRIADVNSIYNPFTEVVEGMQLYIP